MIKTRLLQSFFALLACTLLVWQLIPRDDSVDMSGLDLHTPDWFSVDVVVTDMDEHGVPSREFTAEKLLHYPKVKMTDMLRPTFTMFHPERAPWHLSSDKGRSFHGRNTSDIIRLDLWHDVLLTQTEGGKTTHMETSTIAVFPNDDFAETDQSVLFVQPGQMLTGVGMRAYFDTDSMELFNDVKSVSDVNITSDRFTYNHQTGIASYIGNALAVQDGDEYESPMIEYDTLQKIVKSPQSEEGRTTIVIQPQAKDT